MTFQPAPDCVEVTLLQSQDGVPIVNRWNVDLGFTPTHDDLVLVWGVFDDWITTTLSPNQATALHYESLTVKDISVEAGEEYIAPPTTGAGGAADTPLPNSTAIVASLRTAHTGRNFRGRTYVGGIVEAAQDTPTLFTAGYAIGIVTVFETLVDALTDAGYKLVVLSRWLNNVRRITALATEIISIIVDTKMDNQRRRTAN
jgi:hypothetical protein